MRSLKLMLAAATAMTALSVPAYAEYPEQPITFIIPYGPGGTSDTGARTWGPFMEKCLGQTVVFVNKPGAGGELGFAELANATPDGYTLGALNVPNYPLGTITKERSGLQARQLRLPRQSLRLEGRRSTPRKAANTRRLPTSSRPPRPARSTWASRNFGSDDHIKMLAFMKAADIKVTFIPMADAATSRNAVIGGHVDVSGNSLTEVFPFQNELQTLAIASAERVPELPDVPTFKEQGIDVVGGSNHVLGAPAATPPEVVAKLSGCFSQVAADPAFLEEAKKRALLMNVMDSKQTGEWVAKESETLKALWESDPWIK